MSTRLIRAVVVFTLLAFASATADLASASPPAQSPPEAGASTELDVDSFDFLVAVLNDAYESEALNNALNERLIGLFIENLIAPVTVGTPEEIEQRLSGQDSYDRLISVLTEARDLGNLSDTLSNQLSDLFIENLIVPEAGETHEQVVTRLSHTLLPVSVAVDLPSGWSGFVRHPSGAMIQVPERSTDEAATVEISEVRLPADTDLELAGKVLDFSVGDVTLDRPVTLRIPYELKEGDEADTVVAMHWNEETNEWEEVNGVIDETTSTIRVTTSDLSIFTNLFGNQNRGLVSCDSFQSDAECLANRFAPVLKMHPDERFLPRDVRGFVAQAGDGNIDIDDLIDFGDDYTLDVPKDIQDSSAYPPTVYWTIQSDGLRGQLYLQYYLFYYYDHLNELQQSACARLENTDQYNPRIGNHQISESTARFFVDNYCHPHEADWELIQVFFPLLPFSDVSERLNEIVEEGVTPSSVAYSQHGWSAKMGYDDVQHVGSSHPVAYVALGKHANYFGPPPGDTEYVGLVHDRIAADGLQLEPPVLSPNGYILEGITESTPWVAYRGKWGGEGIDGPDVDIRWNTPDAWHHAASIAGTILSNDHDAVDNLFQEVEDSNGDSIPEPEGPLIPPTSGISPPSDNGQQEAAGPRIELLSAGVISVEKGEEVNLPVGITSTGSENKTFFVEAHSKRYFRRGSYSTSPIGLQQRLNLDPGESQVLNFSFSSDATGRFGLIINVRESVLTPEIIGQADYDEVIRVVEAGNRSDLDLRASGPSSSVDAGSALTYRLEVTNNGPSDTRAVRVEMSLTGGASLAQDSESGDVNSCEGETTITCFFGTVDNGETETGTVAVDVATSSVGVIVNRASAYIADERWVDPVSRNDRTRVTTVVNAAPPPSSPADRVALTALYNSTGGPNWTSNENWLSERPLGEWYGVLADSNGRVVSLDLKNNGLTGPLPPELSGLSSIRALILYVNQLTGSIPPELARLTELGSLRLSLNQLSGPIPSELGRLRGLTALSLGGNRLSGPIPSELGRLRGLTVLSLGSNRLSGEIPPELGNLSNLGALWLQENQLSGEIPSELGNLSNLYRLFLSGNQLTGCIPSELRSVPSNDFKQLPLLFCGDDATESTDRAVLVTLYNSTGGPNWATSTNWLSDRPIGEWYGVDTDEDGSVTKLVLSENQLSGSIPSALGDLIKLKELWINSKPAEWNHPCVTGQSLKP